MGFINEAIRIGNEIAEKEIEVEKKNFITKKITKTYLGNRRKHLLKIINKLPNDRLTMELLKEYTDSLTYIDKIRLNSYTYISQLLEKNHNTESVTFKYDMPGEYILSLTINYRTKFPNANGVIYSVIGPNSCAKFVYTETDIKEFNIHDMDIPMDKISKNELGKVSQAQKVFIEETMKHIKEYLIEHVSERKIENG